MITPEIHRNRHGASSLTISFDGFEVTATALEIISPAAFSYCQFMSTTTVPMFLREVMLKARFSFAVAKLYRNAAEVAVAILQETAPKYPFYCCDSSDSLGIGGKEFAIRNVYVTDDVELYTPCIPNSTNSAQICAFSPDEPIRARVKCLEIIFHAHCKDV